MSYSLMIKGVLVQGKMTKGQLISTLSNLDGESDYNVLSDVTTLFPTPADIVLYQRREKDLLVLSKLIDFSLSYEQMNETMKLNKLRWDSLTNLNCQFRTKYFVIDK